MARPAALTKTRRRAFLEAYAGNGNFTDSAKEAGVSVWTVRRRLKDDAAFLEAFAAAEADFGDRLLNTVKTRAIYGEETITNWIEVNPDGSEKILKRKTEKRRSDDLLWKLTTRYSRDIRENMPPEKVELSGPGGAPIPVEERKARDARLDKLPYDALMRLRGLHKEEAEILASVDDAETA